MMQFMESAAAESICANCESIERGIEIVKASDELKRTPVVESG